jgi:prepilin signal peptidase PulO-like enzyme (type II secretory pathway)
MLSYSLLGGISLLMIWQDVRYKMISLWCVCLFFIISCLHHYAYPNPDGLWVAGLILMTFLGCQSLFAMLYRKQAMGWGDVLLGPICGLWLYVDEFPFYIVSTGIIAFIMGLIWSYRWGSRTFPFVPSLIGGQGVIFLIRCFFNSNGL